MRRSSRPRTSARAVLALFAAFALFPPQLDAQCTSDLLAPSINSGFGASVAASGDRIVVGAPVDPTTVIAGGAATIFVRDADGAWLTEETLAPTGLTIGNRFGTQVAIDGDVLAVATFLEEVYVFRYDAMLEAWVEEQLLEASDGALEDGFGQSLALSGSRLIVGAPNDDDGGDGSGSAYVFDYNDIIGEWIESQKLTASDATADDQFGAFVALDGDVAAIGAPAAEGGTAASGAAYVFRLDAMTDSFSEEEILSASDGATDDLFGTVVLDGEWLAVGAPGNGTGGAVYAYRLDAMSGSFAGEQKLVATVSAGDDFGSSVALDTASALIVAAVPGADIGGTDQGRGVAFRLDGFDTWVEAEEFTVTVDPVVDDVFLGGALAAGDGFIAMGAPGTEEAFAFLAGGDCDDSGTGDLCEAALDIVADCNDNGIPDTCEIDAGDLEDTNLDNIPDICANLDFTFRVSDATAEYNSASGVADPISIELLVSEGDTNPGFPNNVGGLAFGVVYPESVISATFGSATGGLADLNDGNGPDILLINLDPQGGPGVLVGIVFTFSVEPQFLTFEEEAPVISIEFAGDETQLTESMETYVIDLEFSDLLSAAPGAEAIENLVVTTEGPTTNSHLPTFVSGTITLSPAESSGFRRGDCNGNGQVFALLDTIYLLEFGFTGGPPPPCEDAADTDDNGVLFPLLDSLFLLEWAFLQVEPMPAPGTETCGPDPTDDMVTCETEPDCS